MSANDTLVLGAVAGRQTHRPVVEVRERIEMSRVRLTGSRREIDDVTKSDEQMELTLGRRNSNKNNNKPKITLTTNYITDGW